MSVAGYDRTASYIGNTKDGGTRFIDADGIFRILCI